MFNEEMTTAIWEGYLNDEGKENRLKEIYINFQNETLSTIKNIDILMIEDKVLDFIYTEETDINDVPCVEFTDIFEEWLEVEKVDVINEWLESSNTKPREVIIDTSRLARLVKNKEE